MGRTRISLPRRDLTSHFNSLAPCGANPYQLAKEGLDIPFQLTRPVWGEPFCGDSKRNFEKHFNSLAPCGANLVNRYLRKILSYFNSLAPCGANLPRPVKRICDITFQLTRPVWGEPDYFTSALPEPQNFNSLAPCGANHYLGRVKKYRPSISTHSPRVGRTYKPSRVSGYMRSFQLTRPVWGEPLLTTLFLCDIIISTHSPRVGRTTI